MSFSARQSRRLDEVVAELAPVIHEPMMALVKEFADQIMEDRFGKVWDVAELHAAQARVYTVTETDVARELTNRLIQCLLTPGKPSETV